MNIRSVGTRLVFEFESTPTTSERFMLKSLKAKSSPGTDLVWTAPRAMSIYRKARRLFPKGTDSPTLLEEIAPILHDESLDERIVDRLFEYQRVCLRRLGAAYRGMLLAPAPGLGKSAISIRTAEYLEIPEILIVAPLTLLRNWQKQIDEWGTGTVRILRDEKLIDRTARWTITNYEFFSRHPILHRRWPLVIFDESILLKSRSAQRSKAALAVSSMVSRVWLLSGSPSSKSVEDLFQQFRIIRPDVYTSFWAFAEEYCLIERGAWGQNIVGTKPGIDFREEFADIFLPVSPEILNLPSEIHERIDLDLLPSQQKIVDRLIDEFILETESRDIPVATKMTQRIRLLQVSSNLGNTSVDVDESSKTDYLVHLLSEDELPTPTIIWVHFRETGRLLEARLRSTFPNLRIERLSAEKTSDERSDIVDRFQSDSIDLLIAHLGVGKFGLTLTHAQSYVYYERSDDADAIVQSSFRVSRIGLDHTVLALTLASPIDRLIDDNLSGKLPDIGQISGTDWTNLLRSLRS